MVGDDQPALACCRGNVEKLADDIVKTGYVPVDYAAAWLSPENISRLASVHLVVDQDDAMYSPSHPVNGV